MLLAPQLLLLLLLLLPELLLTLLIGRLAAERCGRDGCETTAAAAANP
jgi:hypothetical protein